MGTLTFSLLVSCCYLRSTAKFFFASVSKIDHDNVGFAGT